MKTLFSKLLNSSDQKQSELVSSSDLAHAHKKQGNEYLNQGMIDEAIMHYTKSIVSTTSLFVILQQNYDPKDPIVYTNRAIAFKKHKEFRLMYEDSLRATELNPLYFKA